MNKLSFEVVKGALIIPAGLGLVLVPFSMLIGWNVFTLFLFWFVITPLLSVFLPGAVSRSGRNLFESIAGLTIFYAVMVLMIFDHYKSDYFQVMLLSGGVNVILIFVISWLREKNPAN